MSEGTKTVNVALGELTSFILDAIKCDTGEGLRRFQEGLAGKINAYRCAILAQSEPDESPTVCKVCRERAIGYGF